MMRDTITPRNQEIFRVGALTASPPVTNSEINRIEVPV